MRSLLHLLSYPKLKSCALPLLGLALLPLSPLRAAANWTKVTPAEITAAGLDVQLTGCDYGNGVFVLATYFGSSPNLTPYVFTSSDGATWTRRALPGTATGRTGAPRFLNGRFLLGVTPANNLGNAGNGVILTSTDGITWTSSASLGASINAPGEFAYGNGVYLAPIANTTSQVATSTDGSTWTLRTIVAGGTSSHVTFFQGKFYANNYNTGAGLYSSADGQTWSKIAGAPANPGILAANSSKLLVTFFNSPNSGQSVSTDGVTFTTATPGIDLKTETIKVLNDQFVVTDSTGASDFDLKFARVSTDGQAWSLLGSTDNQYYASEVAYGGGRYVFVGEFNVYAGDANGGIGGGNTGGGGSGGGTAPTITAQPVSQVVALGGSVTFSVTVSGTGLTYQWYFNGVAISGEVAASLTLSDINLARVGSYTVTITSSGGSVTSQAATLTLATPSTAGRITNMSVRAAAGTGDQTLIVGLVVGGAGTSGKKDLLLRAAGPSLAGLGVANFLADPKLTAFSGSTLVDSNDNWAGDAALLAAATRLGAFAFASASSKDAALYASPDAGVYTLHVTGGTSGIALAEIYDATASATDATPRLINVSARAQVGTGDNLLIAGFVVGGSTPRTVLVRALGPQLAKNGVGGTLADPTITIYSGSTKVAENDNWSDATNAASVATTATQVGAGALASGSKDAALLVTLNPGVYTAQVTGVGGTTGVALVELYEAP